MVKRIVIDRTIDFLKKMMHKAVLTIDGQEVVNDTIKSYVYLDGHGDVTSAKIVDAHGIELDTYETQISRNEDGLVIVFELAVKLKGVTNL